LFTKLATTIIGGLSPASCRFIITTGKSFYIFANSSFSKSKLNPFIRCKIRRDKELQFGANTLLFINTNIAIFTLFSAKRFFNGLLIKFIPEKALFPGTLLPSAWKTFIAIKAIDELYLKK